MNIDMSVISELSVESTIPIPTATALVIYIHTHVFNNVFSGTGMLVTKMGKHPMLSKAEVVDNCLTHLHVLSFSSSYEIGKGMEQLPYPIMALNLCQWQI